MRGQATDFFFQTKLLFFQGRDVQRIHGGAADSLFDRL
jgi:hypothetical protein